MPGVRDLLARFRPAGAPGAATAAGVPADRRADLTRELEPVFAALAATHRECLALRGAAEITASQTIARAHEQARAMAARAESDAHADRAYAAAQARTQGEVEIAAIAETAAREAERVRRQAEGLMPALVDRLVDRVRADIAGVVRAAESEAHDG